MHRTRVIFAQSSGGLGRAVSKKTFLLPSETLWDVTASGLAGIWAHLTDQKARDDYEKFLSTKVIQDTVLAQARHGSILTMSLFHNLRNPLFAKHNFDAVEFLEGVAPALETFSDTLGLLVQEMNKDRNVSAEQVNNLFGSFAGENIWRKQAKIEPDSLAARFAKMVTDSNFDDHYYGAKLFHTLTAGTGSAMEYVANSGVVGQVALLNARVIEIDETWQKGEHPEFSASEAESNNSPVAARLDVLYEITQTYQQATDPLSASEQYKSIENTGGSSTMNTTPGPEPATTADSDTNEPVKTSQPEKNSSVKADETKTISETTLAVAVIEGWLHGGPDKALRWRVAMVRDAYEFSS
jgi:hypothetical protein